MNMGNPAKSMRACLELHREKKTATKCFFLPFAVRSTITTLEAGDPRTLVPVRISALPAGSKWTPMYPSEQNVG